MADRWGVKCRGCSDERCREMMVERAIELRTISFMESVNKAWKKERPEIVISLMPGAGSESTAQIETAARGKLKKPAETAPTAEWVAWEAQQEVAKSEAEARKATRGPKKRARAPRKPDENASDGEKEAYQKQCAKLKRRRAQRDE